MKPNPSLTAGAMVLAMTAAVYADEKPAAATPPPAPKPSAGLVNDWLRGQNSQFKAWDFGGQVRARYEVKENGGVAGNTDFRAGAKNDNSYLLLREKIHLGYNHDWFSAYVEGRDSSSQNDRRDPNPESDRFDLHQAFVTVGNKREFPVTAKVGRQEFIYGDERLVGAGDWGNLGRVFDAAKLRYEDKDTWVDGFVGRLVLPDANNFNVANDYDWFSGVYASTRAVCPKQDTQLYFLSRNTGKQSPSAQSGSLVALPSARDIYTVGFRMKSLPGQLKGWDYALEAATQFGSIKSGGPTSQRLDHQASALSAGGGYTLPKCPMSTRVGLEYNFASGDEDANDDKSGTFEQLFPTNHKHYGYMDFVGWKNIHNPRLSLSAKPFKQLLVSLDYHLFWLADTSDSFYTESGAARSGQTAAGNGTGYGKNSGYSSFLGSEIELDATYAVTSYLVLRSGYGHFFAGNYQKDSFRAVGGAKDADYFYVQATFNF